MDRFLNNELREISSTLKSFNIKQKSHTMLESFLVILCRFRHLKDLVDNSDFKENFKKYYKGQKCFKPIVALFNLIYSAYTADKEASVDEIGSLIVDIRKSFPNHPDIIKMGDIELFMLAISSSFRIFHYTVESERTSGLAPFDEILLQVFSLPKEEILQYNVLRNLVEKAFQDLLLNNPKLMHAEAIDDKLQIVFSNIKTLQQLSKNLTKIPHITEELNFCSILFHYDDEESSLFNRLLDSYEQKLLSSFGTDYLNTEIIRQIKLDFLRDECSLHRYDLRNQVNFGFININFKYLSTCKSCNCDITGVMEKTSASNEEGEVFSHNTRITYTVKINISENGLNQSVEKLRVPKIKNFLMNIHENNPGLDLINDYESIAFYQAYNQTSNFHYYRFVNIEQRIKEIETNNPTNATFGLMYINEKRLTQPSAVKIFYSTKFLIGGTSFDKNTSIYVTIDNEEHLIHFIDYIIKVYQILTTTKMDKKTAVESILKSFVFYLPSSVTSEEDFNKWKRWSKEIKFDQNTPVIDILHMIEKKSGMKLFENNEDDNNHLYINCYLEHSKDSNLDLNSQALDKPAIPNIVQNKTSGMILNTGLTDLLDYVYECQKLNFVNGGTEKDVNQILGKIDHFPPSLFLPNLLVVHVKEVSKLLDLGEVLTFDYIEEKIKRENAPINNKYLIVGMICSKKNTNPISYYPVVKENPNEFDRVVVGYTGPDKTVNARIHKIDKDYVEYIIFERKEIEN